jgi:class 3 adenylate cyclase/TolB-like protein
MPDLERRSRRGVLFVDLVESVRLFERDELGAVNRWRAVVAEVERRVPGHDGRLVKSLGDGLVLEFDTIPGAAACALDIQALMADPPVGARGDEPLAVRIGMHVTDILADRIDIYGSGVNLCARIASLAGPGEVVASAAARDLLVDALDARIEDIGECFLKHLPRPIRAFRVTAAERGGTDAEAAPPPPESSLLPVLAVFPMTVQPRDDATAALGHVVADELNAALAPSRDLMVIARMSVLALADRAVDLATCRALLGAHYVLTGTLRVAGDRVVAVVELADTRTRQVAWGGTLRGSIAAILAGEGGLVEALAGAVRGAMMTAEIERARSRPLPTLDSCSLLLGGIALLHRSSREDFTRALALLEALRERHPRQSSVHAWVAKWHVLAVAQGWTGDAAQDTRRAQDAARRAIDLDDRNAIALAIDGLVHTSLLKRLDAGMQRYVAAIEANPNEGLAWALKGTLHAFRGEGEPAVQATRHALVLSPLDPLRYFYETLAATAELAAGNHDAVIALARRSLRGNRTHVSTYRSLAIAQVESGRVDDARATVAELMRLDPRFTLAGYRRWTPSFDFDTGRRWTDALARAGVPE